MAKGKLLLGLDIGSSAIKMCLLKEQRRGYQLKAFATATLPEDSIVDGVVMNASAVVDTIQSLMSRNRIKLKNCAISVSGYSVIVKRITLPLMNEQELEQNFEFEVAHHIPFNIEEVFVDRQILTTNPQVNTMDLLLVAAKREIVNEFLDVVRDTGLTPKVVDVDCFCLQNMCEIAYSDLIQDQTVALVDLGAATTSIIIVSGGVTAFTRDLSMGGNQFTEEIQKKLGITRDEAEQYKISGLEDASGISQEEFDSAIRQVSESIAQELLRSFNFFIESSNAGKIDQIILTGGCANISILSEVVETLTGIPIEIGNPFSTLEYDPKLYTPEFLESVAAIAAVSVGLATRRG